MVLLVTGGLGYIGSHVCVELYKWNHTIIVVDNLSNSCYETKAKIEEIIGDTIFFYEGDVTDIACLENVFQNHNVDAIFHFAGYKSISESIRNPLDYYKNNIVGVINLCQMCLKYNVDKFIFSSSATVYGASEISVNEMMSINSVGNPYGETKVIGERILADVVTANPNFKVTVLRYFNPVGADISGLIGESPLGPPSNIMPIITKVAKGEIEYVEIYGDKHDTVDGTGVRDYIHVSDLALGHALALNHIKGGLNVYNLGAGRGVSVLELIHTFERVNHVCVPYVFVEPRSGDVATSFADVTKAKDELGWIAVRDMDIIVKDVWNFEKKKNDKPSLENA